MADLDLSGEQRATLRKAFNDAFGDPAELRRFTRVVELSTDEPDWSQVGGIAIMQHPKGDPMKLALGFPADLRVNAPGNRLRYSVPTLPGSSGSPVFDTDWRLLGLHHSGDPTKIDPSYNQAVPVHRIATRPKVAAAIPTPKA